MKHTNERKKTGASRTRYQKNTGHNTKLDGSHSLKLTFAIRSMCSFSQFGRRKREREGYDDKGVWRDPSLLLLHTGAYSFCVLSQAKQ